jgi:hypothetical protein
MDGFVFWLTFSFLALFGVIVAAMLCSVAGRTESTLLNVVLVSATIFIVGIAGFAYAYTPKAFHVGDGVLRIERPASDVNIPLASVVEAKPLDVFLGLTLKAPPGGNSGLFGIYGTFYRAELGKFRMYSRRANQTVLLVTNRGNVVVGPDRRDEFVASIRQEKSA